MDYDDCPNCGTSHPRASLALHGGLCRDCQRVRQPPSPVEREGRVFLAARLAWGAIVFLIGGALGGSAVYLTAGWLQLPFALEMGAVAFTICGALAALGSRYIFRALLALVA